MTFYQKFRNTLSPFLPLVTCSYCVLFNMYSNFEPHACISQGFSMLDMYDYYCYQIRAGFDTLKSFGSYCQTLLSSNLLKSGTFCDCRSLAKAVSQLIFKSDVEWEYVSDPSWLCCIPLLHFLDGTSSPFQEPVPSARFQSDEWWGITEFLVRKDRFKRSVFKATS